MGFLVPVFAFGCLLATEASVEAAYHDDNYYQSHGWPKLVALVVAAGFIWFLDIWLEKRPKRRLIDADTGETVLVGGNHSFFFIPVKWWAPICIIIGIALSFVIE